MAPEQTPEPADPNLPEEAAPVEPVAEAAPAAAELQEAAPAVAGELIPAQTTAAEPVAAEPVAAEPLVAAPARRGFVARIGDSARANPVRFGVYTALLLALIVGFFWPAVPTPHVALGGEPIRHGAPSWLTNSILTTLIVDVVLLLLALATSLRMKIVPSGIQNFMEIIVEYFYNLAEQVAGKAARQYFPWIMTIFLLVVLSNWSGLIPGVGSIGWEYETAGEHEETTTEEHGYNPDAQLAMADGSLILLAPQEAAVAAEAGAAHFVPLFRAPSTDLNMTLALALATMVMVQIWGVRALGVSYFRKFFNASGKGFMKGISAFVGILELISELSRILSFGFRLFGNIFAGEIVLATMAFLAAFIIPLPFYVLEVFIGAVQAFVFTMLALVFFSMATASHGEHQHEEHAETAHAPAAAPAGAH